METVMAACSGYQQVLSYKFDNNLGKTIYELYKNEKLEADDEKQTIKNVFLASFVFLSPEQHQQLEKLQEEQGELATFKGGIPIGKLIKKDGNRLKFRIDDSFDDAINAPKEQRLEFNKIREGYIKPIFPGDLINIDRMIRAMEKVTNPGGKSSYFFNRRGFAYNVGYPVNKNLPNFLFDPNEARQSAADIEEEKQNILTDLNEPFLRDNPKQLEAVAKALLAKDMALIQGPPGTGKTTVIAEIIWQALLKDPNAKILITSQTNLAVDNALERIKGKKLVRPIRIGNIDKFEDEGKVYSNDRIKKWIRAKTDSKEEIENSDNAVCEWIESVKAKCSEDEKYSKAVNKWKKGLDEKDLLIKETFSDAYYKYVNVFAATCSECGSPRFSDAYMEAFQRNSVTKAEPEFDIVIMDEASKATPPELVLPLTLGKKVVIIGDHKQLPPMIDEQEFSEALEAVGANQLIEHWTKEDYKVSQFEKLFKNAPKNFVASLDTQFRMHEQIMNCISQFYTDQEELENGLLCGIKGEMNIPDLKVKASRWHGFNIPPFIYPDKHAIWLHTDSPEIQEGGHYYSNDGEVDTVYWVVRILTSNPIFKEYHNFMKSQKEENQEIGIITFYGPQMKKLGSKFYPHLKPNDWKEFDRHKFENEFGIPFRINTVDKFQGMEKNILIISTVRSNRQIQFDANGNKNERPNTNYPRALGFAQEHPRINVGFSRAKRLLIVVGNENHFMRKQSKKCTE
jgi:superfamily I DNA and/or RNA helicase